MDCYELEAAMYLEEQECSLRKSEKNLKKLECSFLGLIDFHNLCWSTQDICKEVFSDLQN